MKLDNIETRKKEIRKYFKYEKVEYIKRFCRQKNTLNSLETSKNKTVLTEKENQNEELLKPFYLLGQIGQIR